MPYLTPDSIPEDDDCRPLSIPASTDWLAIVSGALTELTKSYNWQQGGSVTVAEAVERMQLMIDAYYAGGCDDCELPTGTPPFRVGEDGHLEQLVGGAWVTPEGDYTIPPTPERSEPTPEERRCLAAANAANVLKLLYEDLSDSFAAHLSAIDAAVQLGAAIVGGIGLLFGLISAGLISAAGAAFAGVYAGVEFITADVWTSEFDQILTCILYDCSSSDGDVVHFDYDCFFQRLWDATDLFDVTFAEQRLFYQISVIMNFLGVEALDAAGATTAITSADCDACAENWCYRWFGVGFELGDWDLDAYGTAAPTTYTDDRIQGGDSTGGSPYANFVDINYGAISGNVTLISAAMSWVRTAGAAQNYAILYINGVDVAHSCDFNGSGVCLLAWSGNRDDITSIRILGGVEQNSAHDGGLWIDSLTMRGAGDNPIGVDNCI